jgi:hypothetical protein
MNNPALEQLRDIHLPQAVHWWPPAPGWWVVAALILALTIWLVRFLQRRYRRQYFRSESLDLLKQIWQNYQQAYHQSNKQQSDEAVSADRVLIEKTLALLRRAGKTAQLSTVTHSEENLPARQQEHIESMPSPELLKILDEHSAGKLSTRLPLQLISERLYRPESSALSPEQARCFYDVAKNWLKDKDFTPKQRAGSR